LILLHFRLGLTAFVAFLQGRFWCETGAGILAMNGNDIRDLSLSMRKINLARLLARRPLHGPDQDQELHPPRL
jgi:hypothetical protein